MHALGEGDRVRIGDPRNLFPLAPDATRHVLIAGGIGITPLLAMAEDLAARKAAFVLHYCARSHSRMAFSERVRSGAISGHSKLHLDDGPSEQKLDLDRDLGPVSVGNHVYVCGPSGFMEWVLAGARERGWPEQQLHREYFAAAATASDGDVPFDVQIGREGPIFTVPAGQSVVGVLAQHGIDIPVSCEQGVCGTCITRVLEGQPDHRDSFLTDKERAANDQFTPCCSRACSASLMLDL